MREIIRTYGIEVLLIVGGFVLIPASAVAAGRIDGGPAFVIPVAWLVAAFLVYKGVGRALQKRGDENTLSKGEIEDFAEDPAPGEDLAAEAQSSRAVPPR
jgi:hypothetical protein